MQPAELHGPSRVPFCLPGMKRPFCGFTTWRTIMNKILLIDCSSKVAQIITEIVGANCQLVQQAFDEDIHPKEYRMIIIETSGPIETDATRIVQTRKACCYSPIPIIAVHNGDDSVVIDRFLVAGATDVLSLDAPPGVCKQMLQGYLIPNRMPIEKEMAYLQPFINNTLEVLKKTADMEISFREVYFANDLRIYGDISGIIGLSGNSEGTVAITLYWDLARKIISRMMNVSESQINAEYIHDGAGELINMISGSTKTQFKGTPFHFDLSLPTVVVGSGHQLGHPEGSSIAILIFDVDDTSFILQVCLKPKIKAEADSESKQ
jgi:chemotaxis protein CheX